MEREDDLLLEAANTLLLLSNSPSPDLPPPAMPATSIKNVVSVSVPSWGFRLRRSHEMGKLKRKQVEAETCGRRSPDTPLDFGAAFDASSDGFLCSSAIRPFKRLRAGETSVPEHDSRLKLKRKKKVEGPSTSTAVAATCGESDGFMCSSEIQPFKRLRTGETSVPGFDAHIKLKRKNEVEGPSTLTAVAVTCGHRSPGTPIYLVVASNSSSSESDGFMCSSEIRPFKRLRIGETSVPGCDAHIKLKREQVENPSPLTAVAANCSHRSPQTPLDLGDASDRSNSRSNGFPYSSDIHLCRFRCNDGLKTDGRGEILGGGGQSTTYESPLFL